MKVILLAGGYGTRISEESGIRPKPMVEIGGKPILWHIMKTYSSYGLNEFIICCGYKGHVIKEYFSNYFLHNSDVTFDMKSNTMKVHRNNAEDWKVTLVDTGEATMTGGRIRRIREYVDSTFCLTYGDGVTDLNIPELIAFHRAENSLVTLTAVQPPGRFGAFNLQDKDPKIRRFREKPVGNGVETAWINGGYFVVEPEAIDLIEDDRTVWEREPLEQIARQGRLNAYRHSGFWQSMDTLRDKNVLEDLWDSGNPPWKIWD
ncbi:MAG: glucose-1-phosphate cytidylyltransferase [Bacteroidota bacterium]